MNSKEKYFTWSDAWVFAALSGAIGKEGFDFVAFLATGDMLNHAIMNPDEIRQGLKKLAHRGLIEIDGRSIRKTGLADELDLKVEKKRGGLFSVVDNCLSVLNSPRTDLPHVEGTPNLRFLSPTYYDGKCSEYIASGTPQMKRRRKTGE